MSNERKQAQRLGKAFELSKLKRTPATSVKSFPNPKA